MKEGKGIPSPRSSAFRSAAALLAALFLGASAWAQNAPQKPGDGCGEQETHSESAWPAFLAQDLPPSGSSQALTLYHSTGISQSDAELFFAGAEAAIYLWDTGELYLVSRDHLATVREAAVFFGRREYIESRSAPRLREEGAVTMDGFLEQLVQEFPGLPQKAHGPFILKVPVRSPLPDSPESNRIPPVAEAESIVLAEGFESNPWGRWRRSDSTSGAYTWEVTACDANSGGYSVDAVRGGSSGSLLACDDYFPNGVDTWFTDTQCENVFGASQAWLDFYFTSDAENFFGNNYLAVWYVPGVPRGGWMYPGSYSGWWHSINNMRQWPAKGDLTLSSCNHLQVSFHSEGYFATGFGSRVDDIKVLTGPPDGMSCSISADPLAGPAPLTVSFSAVVTGATGDETYNWKFDDGGTSSEANPSHIYDTPGDYLVGLVVTNGQNDWEVSSKAIKVANPLIPNDLCADAIVVSTTPFSHSQDTTHANAGPSDPTPSCGQGVRYKSVWYQFTPTASSYFLADTLGSGYNTVLSVYTGVCGVLTPVAGACDDDSGPNHTSRLLFAASAGTTYYFMLSSFGSGGQLVFNLTRSDITVDDGGFENGPPPASSWSEYVSTGGTMIITPATYVWYMDAYEGQYVWWGGGHSSGAPISNYVEQSVVVPTNGSLSFYAYFRRSRDDDNDGDHFYASINGTNICERDLTKANNSSQWTQIGPLSLSAYAGQIATLRFGVASFGNSTGNVLLDQVVIEGSSCTAPNITSQPQSQYIASGQTAQLSISATGDATLHYKWYRGSSGSTTDPVGTDSPSFTTPALTSTTSYWVRVSDSCGTTDSVTATVTVITHDQVVLRSIVYNGTDWEPWRNETATISSPPIFVALGEVSYEYWEKRDIAVDALGIAIWDLALKNEPWGLDVNADPGDFFHLKYNSSSDRQWDLGMLIYPRNQDPSTAEVFHFEHAWYPDWPTEEGYPFFTLTRFPKGGAIDLSKEPVVFIHGVGGDAAYWNAGDGLPEAIAALTPAPGKPYEVWALSYPPYAAVQESAYVVFKALQRIQNLRGDGKKLNLVVHSMGGLVVRSMMEGLATKKGSPRGLMSTPTLVGKVVFFQSPMHGSWSAYSVYNDWSLRSTCVMGSLYNEFWGPHDEESDAMRDLSLGSWLTWELNQPSRLSLLPSTSDAMAIVGTKSAYAFHCGESEQKDGSFSDDVVNAASGNLNQANYLNGSPHPDGGALSGYTARAVDMNHRDRENTSSSTTIVNLADMVDRFLRGQFPGGADYPQTQSIPLFKIHGAKGYFKIGDRKLTDSHVEAGSKVYCLDDDTSGQIDLADGSYALKHKSWFFGPYSTVGQYTLAQGGVTTLHELTMPASLVTGESASRELLFASLSGGQALTASIEVTDPSGRVLSSARNDFSNGSQYGEEDFDGNGAADSIASIQDPLPGTYRVRWTTSAGAAPEWGFSVKAYLDGSPVRKGGPYSVYQNPQGEVDWSFGLTAPEPVTGFSAQRGAGDGEVVLQWTDSAGSDLRYDLRYSDAPIATQGDWDALIPADLPSSPSGGSHRILLTLPEVGVLYYFKMMVWNDAGVSPLSASISALSGPGGTPAGDTTPPSRPVVMDEGDTAAIPGQLTFQWSSTDAESGVGRYRYCVGTRPNGTEVQGWTDAATQTSAVVNNPAIVGSQTYYCTVVAKNGNSLESLPGFSDGITVLDACSGDSYEPDNSPETSKPISLVAPQTRNLCADPDYFLFNATAGLTYEIMTFDLEALCRTHLTLMNGTTFTPVAEVGYNMGDSSNPYSSRLSWTAISGGPMVFAVSSGDGKYGAYRGYKVVMRIPFDCDGNGTVSIGEVQKAINMFLGTLAPDCGMDSNGDGTVSIGEVQKVINAFLGTRGTCR